MITKVFETEENPEIHVEEVHGNLEIKGWDRAEVRIECDREDELEASATGTGVRLRCRTNCQLRVPSSSSVFVGSVHGEARIESLQQTLEIGNVASNLNLTRTGSSSVGNVGANLEARQIDGDLEVQSVGGHARVQNITGQFSSALGGHLILWDVGGGVTTTVGGDATLSITAAKAQAYSIHAGNNIRIQFSEPPAVALNIQNGGSLRIAVGDLVEQTGPGEHEFVLGEGGTPMNLTSGGSVLLVDHQVDESAAENGDENIHFDYDFDLAADFGVVAEEIARQVEHHFGNLHRELRDRLSDFADDPQIRKRVQSEMRRAERKIASAQRNLARKLAKERRRAERKSTRGRGRPRAKVIAYGGMPAGVEFNTNLRKSKFSESPEVEPVTDEERMTILRMVEEKKITVDEASQLLDALEGEN